MVLVLEPWDMSPCNDAILKSAWYKSSVSLSACLLVEVKIIACFKFVSVRKCLSNCCLWNWLSTKYKDWRSRENQIRFFNLVRTDLEDYSKDGLSSLDYKVVNKEDNNNIKVVSVTNE